MKVFLTGGTGFIGRRLVQTLVQRGWEVTALVRNPESIGAKAIQTMDVKLIRGDIIDQESLRQTMKKVDALIHNYVSPMFFFGDTGNVTADETFQRIAHPKTFYEQTKIEAHEYGAIIRVAANLGLGQVICN